jgi:hypothetical protein
MLHTTQNPMKSSSGPEFFMPNIPKKYTSYMHVDSNLFLRNKETKFRRFVHLHIQKTLENKQFDP